MSFYVFQVTEAEVGEDLLGPTYRLVCNVYDQDGRWPANTAREAVGLAARQTGRDDIYAAFPSETALVERWPFAAGIAA